jgi:PRTRC genetic system ThiF family protein
METLTIEPTYRVLLGDVKHFRIMLVGCGGTGSSLALALAGLAYHAGQKGIQVELTLVDHDVIELKNCGRQMLSLQAALAGGVPKVADLALRLNAAYGLGIVAWPQRYTADMARSWYEYQPGHQSIAHLIVGCVDSHLGRQEIAKTIADAKGRIWGLDCGNERYNGQVLIGNMTDTSQIELDALGLCTALPSPYVQEPDLLEPDTEEQNESCAEMALAETQSLMVNRMAAAIAAQYVTDFVLQAQVLQMATYFNLVPPTARSLLVTEANLTQYKMKGRL